MRRYRDREKDERARQFRRQPTPAEALLWSAVRNNALRIHIRRQHRVGAFIADFYCARAQVVIELDGAVHGDQNHADIARDEILASQGLLILRFRNEEVLSELQRVCSNIRHVCSNRLGPATGTLPPEDSCDE